MSLRFESVTKRYGDLVALNRVDFAIGKGVTALVGPNGSGKSTFMRLATGHSLPTTGRVTAFGGSVWDQPDTMRRVGYVPEQDAFYEHMSGLEFVSFLGRLRGFGPLEARDAALRELRALGLEEGIDRPIKSYSKGMRQRVKLAQALIHRPELVLMDEPLLGCDPLARKRIQDRIRDAAKDGASILISSHILPEVERMTKQIGFLQSGRLIAQGNAMDIRQKLTSVPSKISIHLDAPRAAAASMVQWDLVDRLEVRRGELLIETQAVGQFLSAMQADWKPAWGYQGHSLVDGDLSSVFGYLAGGKA
ncbi:MAG: ABC transporter ATP-binding protein [Thermoplasmatota archaeon]